MTAATIETGLTIEIVEADDDRFQQVLDLRYEVIDEPHSRRKLDVPFASDIRPQTHHFIVYESNVIIGAARLSRPKPLVNELSKIVTVPNLKTLEVGQALIQVAEATTRQARIRRLDAYMPSGLVALCRAAGFDDPSGIVRYDRHQTFTHMQKALEEI